MKNYRLKTSLGRTAEERKPNARAAQTQPQATRPLVGIVNIPAHGLRSTTLNLSALKPFAQPTLVMEVVMAREVEPGMSKCPAASNTAAKPCTG